MKLLIISHCYFPSRNARAFRWTALAEHWAAAGHDVDVVTSALPGMPARETIAGVEVHRVGGRSVEKIRAKFGPGSIHPAAGAVRRSIVRRMLKTLHDWTWKRIYWPDSAALWIRPAVKMCRNLLTAEPGRTVVSVSLPFSSHVVGYFAQRRRKGATWIMDVGDPFAFMVESPTNNHTLFGSFNFWAEGRLIEQASAVSVTTDATLRRYVATFPGIADRISEIPPLVQYQATGSHDSMEAIPMRLVYLGTMYLHVRGPDRLLALFQRIVRNGTAPVELHLYGDHSAYQHTLSTLPSEISERVFVHGLVDREETFAAMRTATALVNIGNDTTYQLPSKLVEYAAFAKPIINVVSQQNDSSLAFLRQHPCVRNVIGDEADTDAVAIDVLRFLEECGGRSCAVEPVWLERFSLDSIAARYETVFDLAGSRGRPLMGNAQ